MQSGIVEDFGDTLTRWRTWFLLGNQDIYLRYKRSVIGPFWISISLAAMIAGMALLYSQIFDLPFRDYLYWLACSLVTWMLLSSAIMEAGGVLIESEGALRNVPIAQTVLVMRMMYRNLLIFLHNLAVVLGLMLIFGFRPELALVMAVPGLIVILAVGFFYALATTALCLRFRDFSQVVATIMQILFFLTPIIWRPDQGRVAPEVILYNPFYHLIELFRAPLLGYLATPLNWLVSGGVLAFLVVCSLVALAGTRRRIFLWL